MPTTAQTRKIHVLKRELRLDDREYRAILANYRTETGEPVQSSARMTPAQAGDLIELLERQVDKTPGLRNRLYASPAQIRKIFALWRQVSRARDSQGVRATLRAFLRRGFHISRPGRIPRGAAPRVIKALRVMNQRRGKPPAGAEDARSRRIGAG
jgi:hypothetical protein